MIVIIRFVWSTCKHENIREIMNTELTQYADPVLFHYAFVVLSFHLFLIFMWEKMCVRENRFDRLRGG